MARMLCMVGAVAYSSLLIGNAEAASVGAPDLTACPTKTSSFTFFGKPNKAVDCRDCTTVTYIDGSKGPAACKTYDNWVKSVTSGTNKVVFGNAAGILPGALDNTNPRTNWFEVTLTGSSAPLDTLPAGAFDQYADNIFQIFISASAPVKLSNGVFAKPMPKLKTIQLNLPTNQPSTGINSQLLNSNVGKMQTFQLKFGNLIDATLLNNLPELRTIIIFSAKATSIPADLFAKNKRIKTILLGGGAEDNIPKMPIKSVPANLFSTLNRLDRVDLKFTTLPSLPATIFAKNPLLNSVNFDSNEFTALPATLFSANPALGNVFLFGNKLAALPATLFSSVSDPSKLRIWLESQRGTSLTCATAGAALPEGSECY